MTIRCCIEDCTLILLCLPQVSPSAASGPWYRLRQASSTCSDSAKTCILPQLYYSASGTGRELWISTEVSWFPPLGSRVAATYGSEPRRQALGWDRTPKPEPEPSLVLTCTQSLVRRSDQLLQILACAYLRTSALTFSRTSWLRARTMRRSRASFLRPVVGLLI